METKNNEENGVLRERFALAMERIGEIAGEATVPEAYQPYFRRTAGFILTMEGLYGEIKNGHTEKYTLEEWQTLNRSLYQDILPEHYEKSYANPDYALEQLGETHSRLLCFLYTELRTMIVSAFEQRLEEIVVLAELFIEVYNAFEGEELPSYREIQQILYWFKSDYSELFLTERLEDQLNPDHDFAKKILMKADLSDLSYLYKYGEYISDNELKMAEYINQLSEEPVFCTEPERPLQKEDRQCAFCHWFRADDPKSGGKFPGHGTGACDLPGSPRCASGRLLRRHPQQAVCL